MSTDNEPVKQVAGARIPQTSLISSAGARIQALSKWVDEYPANANRDPEALTWGRLSKLAEEAGEVIDAYIGYTAQNPRKGPYATLWDVKQECLDVALAALGAYEHLSNNEGYTMEDFLMFITDRYKRTL